MSGKLDDDDRRYLRMAVELSRTYRDDHVSDNTDTRTGRPTQDRVTRLPYGKPVKYQVRLPNV
jgi:hypothetical protein